MPLKVIICRQPGATYQNEIEVCLINNVHWDRTSGGVHKTSGYYLLYGYIPYAMAQNLVSCSGRHIGYGNDAKICICKSHNQTDPYKDGYHFLAQIADTKPPSIISLNRPKGEPPCTKKILALLSEASTTRRELREKLRQIGYQPDTIRNALKSL